MQGGVCAGPNPVPWFDNLWIRSTESGTDVFQTITVHTMAPLFDMDGILVDSTPAVSPVWTA